MPSGRRGFELPREVVALPGRLVGHGAHELLEEGVRAWSGLEELTFVVVERKVDRADERAARSQRSTPVPTSTCQTSALSSLSLICTCAEVPPCLLG